jgi:hypothetical protein
MLRELAGTREANGELTIVFMRKLVDVLACCICCVCCLKRLISLALWQIHIYHTRLRSSSNYNKHSTMQQSNRCYTVNTYSVPCNWDTDFTLSARLVQIHS